MTLLRTRPNKIILEDGGKSHIDEGHVDMCVHIKGWLVNDYFY